MLQLSDRQRITIGTAVTVLAAVIIVAAIATMLFLIGAFFNRFASVLLPIAVAGVLALVLKPYYEWWANLEWWSGRMRLPKVVALTVVFVSILIPIVGLGWFFGAIIAEQIGDLVHRIPEARLWAEETMRDRWPQFQAFLNEHPWGVRLKAAWLTQQDAVFAELGNVSGKALSLGAGALRGIGGLLGWAVFPVYLAFFLMAERPKLVGRDLLPFLKKDTRDDVLYLVREFVEIVVAFFRGQLLIALLQGVLFAIGFSVIGLRYGLVLGLTLGFLNIIPYLGSIVGLGVCLPLAMWQPGGSVWLVLWVLVVFTVVQMIEGYILTPRIMGNQTGLHPLAIIIAIFFWGSALGGIAGMILAIPLTAFLVIFWRLAKEKYITELV